MPNERRRDDLYALARLFKTLNGTLAEISSVIGRPAQVGHAGEFIASAIFDIDLHPSASTKDHDGFFSGNSPLSGRSVNVKWGLVQEGGLDLSPTAVFDDLLVLTGPRATVVTAASKQRPWVISAVYLFDATELVGSLHAARRGVGEASSVRKHVWETAMIYPEPRNPRLVVSEEQRALLAMFAPSAVTTA